MEVTVGTVFIAAMITAIFTGFGAIPLLWVKHVSKHMLGLANAAAAGLMLGASIGLVIEGAQFNILRLVVGLVIGVIVVMLVRNRLEGHRHIHGDGFDGIDATKMLLIVGVMTAHSFAEGIGVGVSYGDGSAFGTFVSVAIAIHNIPEGLAISLVLVPRGASVWKAAGWSVFSSLPQPLMAVPAFLFVLTFRPFLPVGLGLAAGAMFWMVFNELLPEALEDVPRLQGYTAMSVAMVGMLVFQVLIS